MNKNRKLRGGAVETTASAAATASAAGAAGAAGAATTAATTPAMTPEQMAAKANEIAMYSAEKAGTAGTKKEGAPVLSAANLAKAREARASRMAAQRAAAK